MRKRGKARLATLLSTHHFSPLEVSQFKTLGRMTPTLKTLIHQRDVMRSRFEKLASSKIDGGRWSRQQVPWKWWESVARMYKRRGWMVKHGGAGNQAPLPMGKPNPWCLYRHFEKVSPTDRHVSPWQLRKYPGKSKLERGLVLVQQLEKGARTATQTQLRHWIGQKRIAIAKTGEPRKSQLKIELGRLENLLEGAQ